MTERMVAVVNPASGGGRTGAAWPAIERALRESGLRFDRLTTAAGGDATALTRAALAGGATCVVAVGGDGTLNEVVNGFFTPDGSPLGDGASLGMVPSGTGGDFRRSAGIPAEPAAAAALLASGDRRSVDIARLDYLDAAGAVTASRHFVNIADCGLGGEVVRRVNAGARHGGGRVTFAVASMWALATYRPGRARVVVDGTPVGGRMQNVVVANGCYFGGGMCIAPQARLDDGLLDVVVLGDIGRLRALAGMPRVYAGTHIGRPGIAHLQGRTVEILPEPGTTMAFDVEGELVGAAPARATVLPLALAIRAPSCGPA